LAAVRQLVIEEWQNQRETVAAARRRSESELSRLKEQRDRLDRHFALEQSIDQETYARLRSELDDAMFAGELQVHDTAIEELDLEATLTWAEQMLPKLASLWDEANSADKRRLQAAVFQHGIVVSANQIGTPVSALAFDTWELFQAGEEQLVRLRGSSWNSIPEFLKTISALRTAV
jgi:hypothetical protein